MSERRKQFPFSDFEPRWQNHWEKNETFRTPNPGDGDFDPGRPKYYVLDMFPYPSGAGLHVGHPEGYTATDIMARYKRMKGFNVLHPMGWDAFGLPAEQHAIKTGEHPRINTAQNIDNFRRQLKRLGFSYDWSREVNTTDPAYVRWTQWIFLQLYNSYFDKESSSAKPVSELEAKGWSRAEIDAVRLAYVDEVPVNWSPDLGTVLANEEVEEWKSKGHTVERRPLKQWMLRITAYADRLIEELEDLDWPEGIKLHQRNWIGRSEGAEVDFTIEGEKVTVFTTRPDTLFGATYMVLSPEHPLVGKITTEGQRTAVEAYCAEVASKSDLDRTELNKDKTGVDTGAVATNPMTGGEIPVWIADYVLMSYGTGAIMAVPAHDERDLEFATRFGLPVLQVVEAPDSEGTGSAHRQDADATPGREAEGAGAAHRQDADATPGVAFTGNGRGIGFQPMDEGEGDGNGRGIGFQPMDENGPLERRRGANLPHWIQDGVTYAVTFRLADSIPSKVVRDWKLEKEARLEGGADKKEVDAEFSAKLEQHLDGGAGDCHMGNPDVADLVEWALRHFDGKRYALLAWAVMPNHVHVILRPNQGEELAAILHSWKSFTAQKANVLLNREGGFWQAESYDRIIRDSAEFRAQVAYVEANPTKAGLKDWRWVSEQGGAGAAHRQDAEATLGREAEGTGSAHRQDADATPGREAEGTGSAHRQDADATPGREAEGAGAAHRQDADATPGVAFTGNGTAVNSGFLDGLPTPEAKEAATAWLEKKGVGRKMINFKLRDWLFSRQRYWGEPFPIEWDATGRHRALPDGELPLLAPELDDYKPSGSPEPLLSKATDWVDRSDGVRRETNTMPQWAGSCWYYLRYCDAENPEAFISKEAEDYWMGGDGEGGVDLYVGGTEHAVLHLLYARFWHKVLYDLGHLSKPEPFQRLVNQGLIMGEDGQKMSKSRGNVVNPDDVVDEYGADSLRLYEMFMGPLEQVKPWSMKGVEGVYRFLGRVWRAVMEQEQDGGYRLSDKVTGGEASKDLLRVLHQTIEKVTSDTERMSFNTAISQMMVYTNALTQEEEIPASAVVPFLALLSPYAPHMAEELYAVVRGKFPAETGPGLASDLEWPEHDPALLVADEIELVVQVNGKVRDRIKVATELENPAIEEAAKASPKVAAHLEGVTVRKVIVVPGRLVNIVAN